MQIARETWDPKTASWLDLGGAEVICHVRGGGELGPSWHESGQRRNKSNSINDTVACAERLIEKRFTTPGKMALLSGSAGGIITNNPAVTRPELFAAVVTKVGIADLLSFHRMPAGPASIPEFGDINDPSDRAVVEKISAYQLVNPQQRLPSILLTIGWNDSRLMPWQPAKFAASLKETASRRPILVRTDFAAGHGLATFSKRHQIAENTDIFMFLVRELDMKLSFKH